MDVPTDPLPKYARLETERRWLVESSVLEELDPWSACRVTDKYVEGGRLRLRRVEADGEAHFKLCKKYGRVGAHSEPIVNTYLTESEYETLDRLKGTVVTKLRYPLAEGSVDVYEAAGGRLAIYEVEFLDAAGAEDYVPPDFVTREVTGEEEFDGSGLALRLGAPG